MAKHVFVLSENDYGKSAMIATYGGMDGVYTFYAPRERFHGILLFLYKVHNTPKTNQYFRLPFRKLWSKVFLPKSVKNELNENDCIVFHFSRNWHMYSDIGLYDYLRKKYRNCKFVYSFSDRVELYNHKIGFHFDKLRSVFDLICTYNGIEAKNYGITLSPPVLLDYSYVADDSSIPETDVFFIGREKGRLDRLINVYEKCTENNLKCDFFITDVAKEDQLHGDKIVYNKYLAYDDAMKRAKKAKCIVNLMQNGATGITLRDYEAITMNKILITDNEAIKDFRCYNESKVVMYDELEKGLYKINNEAEKEHWNRLDDYSAQAYLDWVDRLLGLGTKESQL